MVLYTESFEHRQRRLTEFYSVHNRFTYSTLLDSELLIYLSRNLSKNTSFNPAYSNCGVEKEDLNSELARSLGIVTWASDPVDP